MKKEKEKEPEKLDKLENSAVLKKKGFEEEHKDSDDDSSDDEQVRRCPGDPAGSGWHQGGPGILRQGREACSEREGHCGPGPGCHLQHPERETDRRSFYPRKRSRKPRSCPRKSCVE